MYWCVCTLALCVVDDIEEQLRALLLAKLEGGAEEEEAPVKVLDEVSLHGVVKHIQKLAASESPAKILVMTGAGISTAAGIPDFRSPGTGLYDNLQKYNLPEPTAVFNISYFRENPKPFFHLGKELYPGKFKPTLSHYFIKLLETKGVLLRNYTQNIDTLERRAGVSGDVLVEAHGSFNTAHCITCGKEYQHAYVKEKVFSDELPMCTEPGCAKQPSSPGDQYSGIIKPDIVFFGESLPERFAQLAMKDTKECQLLIVMGTSLVVQPFASLANRVPRECPRLLINMERVGQTDPLMLLMGMGAGFDFNEATSYRDVFEQGTCDDGVRKLASMLGWEDELMKLYHSEHARLDAEMLAEGFVNNTPTDDKEQGKAPPTTVETDRKAQDKVLTDTVTDSGAHTGEDTTLTKPSSSESTNGDSSTPS